MRKTKHTYTIQQLLDAVNESKSYSNVLKLLNLNASGNAYAILKRQITMQKIDISHFTGSGWLKGTSGRIKAANKISLADILEGKHPQYQSHKLRLRLIEERYFEHKCYKCEGTTWLGLPIPIQLEHIDGNNENNKLENLTILCPNCHSMTATFAGRNKGVGRDGRSRTDTELPDAF